MHLLLEAAASQAVLSRKWFLVNIASPSNPSLLQHSMATPKSVNPEIEKNDSAESLEPVVTAPDTIVEGRSTLMTSDEEEKVSISAIIAVFVSQDFSFAQIHLGQDE